MLAICVCGAGQAPGRMCWLYVCVVLYRHLVICVGYMFMCVVLDRHLVCLVLAALWLYVKWGAWHAPDARGEWLL